MKSFKLFTNLSNNVPNLCKYDPNYEKYGIYDQTYHSKETDIYELKLKIGSKLFIFLQFKKV